MADIFLICPVRDASDATNGRIRNYLSKLTGEGRTVHWPARDTKQDDDQIGTRICRDNREAMFEADETHIWFDHESRGSRFDFGMILAFIDMLMHEDAKPRKMVLVNTGDLCSAPPSAYQRILAELLDIELSRPTLDTLMDTGKAKFEASRLLAELGRIRMKTDIELGFVPGEMGYVILGMLFAYMRDHPRRVTLRPNTTVERTVQKSFNNVLHALVDHTRDGAKTF